MTVYIVQIPRPKNGWTPDFSKAAEYGRLDAVFSPDDMVYAMPQKHLNNAVLKLKEFDEQSDFILWPNLGDPTALQCVCFALGILGFNKARFLYWQRNRCADGTRDGGFYTPIEFNLEKKNV